jgi:hypothetical protein
MRKLIFHCSFILINSLVFSQKLRDAHSYIYPANVAYYEFQQNNSEYWDLFIVSVWGSGTGPGSNPLESVNISYSFDTLVIQAYHNVLSIMTQGGGEYDTISLPPDWQCNNSSVIYEIYAILDYGDHIDTVPGYPDTLLCQSSGLSESLVTEKSMIFPNPASEHLTIDNAKGKRIRMHSMSGRLIHNFIAANELTSIDVSKLKPGLYIVFVDNTPHKLAVH